MNIKKVFVGIFSVMLLVTVGASSVKADSTTYDYNFITYDNGMNGLWATDYFNSKVTFTPTTGNCYNVVREDGGTFEVLPGTKSPGGNGTTLVGDGTRGTISGRIEIVICGTLMEEPLPNDTEDLTVGSYSGYADKYFHRFFSDTPVITNWVNWGWTFTTCNNGTWVDNNETEGIYGSEGPNDTMGDITGIYVPCAPTNKDQCKKDGWRAFKNLAFKNQGQCVSYVQANEHAGK